MASTENNLTMADVEAHKESYVSADSAEDRTPVDQNDIPADGDSDGDIEWKNLNWWQCGMIMVAESISLGILSLPSTLATIGLIPGVFILVCLGLLAWYSGYLLGQFRLMYPTVHSMGDAFEILGLQYGDTWGAIGREVGGTGLMLIMIFLMGSHILTWIICMEHLTDHATCNIVWGVVGAILCWMLDLPRTLKKVSYLSIVSSASVVIAVFITMIALAVDKPVLGEDAFQLWPKETPKFYMAFLSVSNIVFAFAGHAAFFSFISELKDPRDFNKSLALLSVSEIILYVFAAVFTYVYAGQNVKSPALSSTKPLFQKISYGIAIPTIIIAGVIYGHVNAKYIFTRIFRGTEHMTKRTNIGAAAWIGLTTGLWIIAWVIAESIPFFNSLLGLIASLFGSWFAYGAPGFFGLHISGVHFSMKEKKKTVLTILNVLLIVVATIIFVLGTYSSGHAISVQPKDDIWSCGVKSDEK